MIGSAHAHKAAEAKARKLSNLASFQFTQLIIKLVSFNRTKKF